MDGNKCILQLRGVRPFLSDKFDITKHKRYRELSDYDEKNAFDVEAYMKHQLKIRRQEEFDLYAVLVSTIQISDNMHSALFGVAAYTVILCFSLMKTGNLSRSIFNAH